MTNNTEQIRIFSENGKTEYPNELVAKMDPTDPDCPITFFMAGIAIFSLGANEVDEFCKQISKLAQ
jgi:hypothetical protein